MFGLCAKHTEHYMPYAALLMSFFFLSFQSVLSNKSLNKQKMSLDQDQQASLAEDKMP